MKQANIPPFKDKSKIRTTNHLPSSQVDVEKILHNKLQEFTNVNSLYYEIMKITYL